MWLSDAERDDCNLKENLRKTKEDLKHKDKLIGILHYELSGVQKNYNENLVAWKEMHQVHKGAKEDLKKRDEDIVSLHQRFHTQLEGAEQMRVNINQSIESWQREGRHLKELLAEKDEQISRAHEKQRAHEDSLDQRSDSALKQLREKCIALQIKLHQHLRESGESRQRKQEETILKLSHSAATSGGELPVSCCQSCKKRAQLLKKQKQELEEMLKAKQKKWEDREALLKKDLHLAMMENIHCQVCYLTLSWLVLLCCLSYTIITYCLYSYGENNTKSLCNNTTKLKVRTHRHSSA